MRLSQQVQNEADEIGQATPSTETRTLFCIAVEEYVKDPVTKTFGWRLNLRYRHGDDEGDVRLQHNLMMHSGGFRAFPYRIIGIAPVVGYKVMDNGVGNLLCV